jgi:hypothetical protein
LARDLQVTLVDLEDHVALQDVKEEIVIHHRGAAAPTHAHHLAGAHHAGLAGAALSGIAKALRRVAAPLSALFGDRLPLGERAVKRENE